MTTKKKSTKPARKKYVPDPNKKPYAEEVAERIIVALEAGTAPWQKPWKPGRPNANMPQNPVSGTVYKGINRIMLLMSGYSDPRWMTYKQSGDLGAQVRKGEKGTLIQYWAWEKLMNKEDDSGNVVKDSNGKPVKVRVKLSKPTSFYATVFNAEQMDGLSPYVEPEMAEEAWDSLERVEKIISHSGANIKNIEGDRAAYFPVTDRIEMPERHQFETSSLYYATLLHELGHWTGHPSRLKRDMSGSFGSESYAKEELRAEIASMMLGSELGIGHDPGQHVAYVKSWIKKLREDPLEIFRAASDAEKIKDYMFGLELDKDYNPNPSGKKIELDDDISP